jgi:lysozyme family protein
MAFRAGIALLALVGLLALSSDARAGRTANVAALQVGLQARGLYAGTIDGIMGPGTRRAVRALQRRAGISVDGVVGPQTRRALGRYARHRLGDRMLHTGNRGWDVATLQFKLAWHGFPSGTFDGVLASSGGQGSAPTGSRDPRPSGRSAAGGRTSRMASYAP